MRFDRCQSGESVRRVAGFAADQEVILLTDQLGHPSTRQRMIVHDQDPALRFACIQISLHAFAELFWRLTERCRSLPPRFAVLLELRKTRPSCLPCVS